MIKLSNGVEISEDTVVSALKKAGISVEPKPKLKQVKIHCFRASKLTSISYPYYLGCVRTPDYDIAPRQGAHNQDAQITAFSLREVKQIIAGLQDLFKE